jgi:two-component system chemotaxis sensor kinase CheA
MADPYRYFRIEAGELVGALDQGLLDLEARADPEALGRVLRHAHTLKGAARIVKHATLARLAHELEDVLAPLRGQPAPAGALVARAVALVAEMTREVAALTAPAPVVAPVAAPAAAPADDLAIAAAVLGRIDGGMLDHVIGELDEAHAVLAALRRAHPELGELELAGRELAAARRGTEQLRLQPAGAMFRALERTARDAGHDAGKEVELVATGRELRIEARVLAGLQGALVQLVRNAVAHGLEPAAERRAAGKPAAGRIAIELRLRGDRVTVRCEDDGRGIDLAAVRALARARGETELGDDALIARLLRGGLSTRSGEVTPLAGRGVGLDVVSAAARSLGGTVQVQTRVGRGTAIAIDVPFTLSALATLVVAIGDRSIAIPRGPVQRVVGVPPEVVRAGALADGVAVAALTRVLGYPAAAPRAAVVLRVGDAIAAIAVDRVCGFEDAVVRPLPADIPVDPVIRGLALDDAGRPRPVLEPAAVIAQVLGLPPEPAVEVAPRLPVLVVDDSLTSRMLEQSILEAAGYEVDVAASAELGLARFAERRYGLCLVDVEMPGMDGFGFVASVRGHSAVPIVMVTSRDAPADRARGRAAGAQGYLIKGTLDPNELLALVGRLLA